MTFDGFISYSHAADGRLAPAVQRGLHRLAKPWHRRRALWIFRDQTGLAVTPGLWSSIQTALDGSEYFVLLASPEAAQSPWVNREIEHWMATKSAGRILPVVTDGEWAWDAGRGDFSTTSTAVPPALRGVFSEEPLFLDLRWARGTEHLSLHHSRFRDSIAQLAAPMHGISKDELEGEDVRQHRRARRLRSGAAVTLIVLALLASFTGMSAVRNAERAKAAAAEALRQEQMANGQRDNAERSAEEARIQEEIARRQQARAAEAAAEAEKSERQAEAQQKLADQATAEAQRQQRLADQATQRTKEQQQRAATAAERAQKAQQEAERLARIAAGLRLKADQAAAEARRQQAKADQQERIAVSRRLINQAKSVTTDDPKTAMMLGAAAQQLNPDEATRRQLSGVVTATNYAGTLDNVKKAVYRPDGDVLAALGDNGRVVLWNMADPRRPVRLAILPEQQRLGGALVFSPDGRTLVVANRWSEAVLWNVADPSRPVRLSVLQNDGVVSAVAFSGNGNILVAGHMSGVVGVWDTTDRARPARLATVPGYGYPVDRVALSPNGRLLVVDAMRVVPVYDLSDPTDPVQTRYIVAYGGPSMTFSPDGSTLAVGDQNGRVQLWDMTNRTPAARRTANAEPPPAEPLPAEPAPATPGPAEPPGEMPTLPPDDAAPFQRLPGLTGLVTSVTYSRDGSLLAAGDQQGGVQIWDRSKPGSTRTFGGIRTRGPVFGLSFAGDAKTLATADGTATATLWRVTPSGAPDRVAALTVNDTVMEAAFRPDGRSLIATRRNGTANTWNTVNPSRPVRGADLPLRNQELKSVAFSRDHRRVATLNSEYPVLRVTDMSRPAVPVPVASLISASVLAISPDGGTVAVVANPTTVMLWDVSNLNRVALLGQVTGATFGSVLAFSPDGRTLATVGNEDYSISLWNVADRTAPRHTATLTGHSGYVTSLAFSPNGRHLASAGWDLATLLWDVTDRTRPYRLAKLGGQSIYTRSAAFSPDGRTLATGGPDSQVDLWDTANPAEPIRLGAVGLPTAAVAGPVAFRRDGQTLAVTSHDYSQGIGTVALWNLQKLTSLRADPARYACATAGRGLSAAEWARFVPEIPYRRTCSR
jgi:WD40 repeat protein